MRKSLTTAFFLTTVLITFFSILILGSLWIYIEYASFKNEEEKIRQENVAYHEEMIKRETEKAIKFINSIRNQTEDKLKGSIKEKVYQAYAIALNLYTKNKGSKSNGEIAVMIREAIRPLRYNNGRGYFFITNLEGIVQLNPTKPEYEGGSFNTPETIGVVQDMIKLVREFGEGFYEYAWIKMDDTNRQFPKIAFVKHFEPFNWYIGTGEYLDDFEEDIKGEILNYIEQISFGKDGYIFAGTYDGISLSGPAKGRNMYEVTDANGLKLVQELIKAARSGGGFIQYIMPDLEGKRPLPKLSYSLPVKDWQWYVGAGVYLADIEEMLFEKKSDIRRRVFTNLVIILFIIVAVLVIAFLTVYILSRKLNRELNIFSNFFEQASSLKNAKYIEERDLQFSEFEGLASSANEMINARRKAENALKESEEKYRALAENSPDIIMRYDKELRYLYASPSVENVTGMTPDEFTGKTHKEIGFPLEEYRFWDEKIRTVFDTRQPVEAQFELNMNNKKTIIDWHLMPEFSVDGSVETVLSTARDITEQVEMENQLRQSQKMEAVGQLAGGIAHDFNNLLQAIHGYTDLSINDLPPEHPVQGNLGQVIKATSRSESLVRQLLTFSRRESIKPEYIDLNEIIGSLIKIVSRVIGEHIELQVVPGHNLKNIYADPGQIEQILMNLCVNARDAMPEGGKILIETRNTILNNEYCENHTWAREGEYVLFSISDTGTGIPIEIRDRIFEPFFTTKQIGEGTGLGLATVYGIVKQNDGLINIYSELERGTVFKIYIPASDRKTEKSKETKKDISDITGSETILLAEDEIQVRELAVKVLEKAGYKVLVAQDGESAIELFKKEKDRIDLAILDVIMPGKSGKVVSEFIQKINPDLPVIFCSGYSKNYLGADFEPSKNVNILQKPIGPTDLLKAIRALLGDELPN